MESESRQAHWQNVYTKKGENEVSWFQEIPVLSLEMIERVEAPTLLRFRHRGRRNQAAMSASLLENPR